MKTLIAPILVFISLLSFAASGTPLTERELRREITKSAQICSDLDCDEATIKAEVVDIAFLTLNQQQRLREVADHFVQVWGDTILEGDYIANDHFELEEVEILYHQEQPTGFRITYSAQAWDTGTCNYDSNYPESIEACLQGRIVEKGILTLDGQGFFVDPTHYAEFYE